MHPRRRETDTTRRRAHARRAQRVKRHGPQAVLCEQREFRRVAERERRRVLPDETRHRHARAVIAETERSGAIAAADMRQRIECHADITRPAIVHRHVLQLRKERDHRALQRIEAGRLAFLAERIAPAEEHAAIHLAEPLHHAARFGIAAPVDHEFAIQFGRQRRGRDHRASERHEFAMIRSGSLGQIRIRVGRDDDLLRSHRAARRFHEHAPVSFPRHLDHRRGLVDRHAARGQTGCDAAHVFQRQDRARVRAQHAADEALRAGLMLHLRTRLHAHRRIVEHRAHPVRFGTYRLQRAFRMRATQAARVLEARTLQLEFVDEHLDGAHAVMREPMHALRDIDAMRVRHRRKRHAKLRRHHAAIAPARAPADRIRVERHAFDAALLQRICGAQTRITRADDRDFDIDIACERRTRAHGRIHRGYARSHRPPQRFGLRARLCRRGAHDQAAARTSSSTASASAASVANFHVGVVTASGTGVAPKPFMP